MTDFMFLFSRTWWFWAWFSFKVAITDLTGLPGSWLGVAHASPSIYVTGRGIPPVGVPGVTL